MPAYPAFTVGWDTVIAREAAWFALEPAFTGCPPLLKAAGGPFDKVQGYTPKITPRARDLWIWREMGSYRREAFGGRKELRSDLHATIFWPLSSATGKLEVDLQGLETAVVAVITRIQGPLGDNSHGGRFVAAGETSEEIRIRQDDPFVCMSTGAPLRVDITYVVLDDLVA